MTIEVTDITLGTTQLSETLHFTGGLVARPQQAGDLALGPVDTNHDGDLVYLLMAWPEVLETTRMAGCAFVGVNQTYDDGSPVRAEVWRPTVPLSDQQLHAGDTWSALSHQARLAGDAVFAEMARNLSVSIHAAGVRLRDVARAHHEQLGWALLVHKKPGSRFSNMAMTDLYLAFHSLASELCSARDYLANIAAVMAGAKDSVESMARLETWLGQPANARHATEPLVALLMAQMGSKKVPGWLRDLGTVRNTMLHRQPMGANPAAGALRMGEIATRKGSLRPLRLVAQDPAIPEGPDPFGELVTLYNRFEMLAIEASRLVPHRAEPPLVTVK
jgi:hypothetical protein